MIHTTVIMSKTEKNNSTIEISGTTADDPDAIGRIKTPPVCLDTKLKKEAMSSETLQQWVFPEDAILPLKSTSHAPLFSNQAALSSGWSRSSNTTSDSQHQQLSNAIAPSGGIQQVPVAVVSISSNNDSYIEAHPDDLMTGTDTAAHHYNSIIHSTKATSSNNSISSGDGGGMKPPYQPQQQNGNSSRLNKLVALRKTSRQGRTSQRWLNCSSNDATGATSTTTTTSVTADIQCNNMIRLTTGCVPIMRDGRILFVSASRKSNWILPKGGWEADERMEESAIRECFEEAGCLGILGPPLSPVQYETRKAKKRRMELQQKTAPSATSIDRDAVTTTASKPIGEEVVGPDYLDLSSAANTPTSAPSGPPAVNLSAEVLSRLRKSMSAADETLSVGSTLSNTYSRVQMTLFPMYVKEIRAEWPEQGRFRKALPIDDAISMLDDRPELRAALLEVKERGLHMYHCR